MDTHRWVEVVIEVPRFGFVKRDPDGRVDIVSPLPCPFNYGCVPGTLAPDGDPIDVVVLGPRRPAGHRERLRVWGTVDFLDAGDEDPKLIVADRPVTRWERWQVGMFFMVYALLKRGLNAARRRNGKTAYRGWKV